MIGEDLELTSAVLIRWNGIAGWCSAEGTGRGVCEYPVLTTIGAQRSRHSVLSLLTPKEERNKVKKLLTMVFALVLTASLSFAQDSSSSGQSGTSGSTASSGQTTSGDQSTTTTKTKKHHKKHKKSTSTTDSGSTAGTSNPK